jgi:hypothetical protein
MASHNLKPVEVRRPAVQCLNLGRRKKGVRSENIRRRKEKKGLNQGSFRMKGSQTEEKKTKSGTRQKGPVEDVACTIYLDGHRIPSVSRVERAMNVLSTMKVPQGKKGRSQDRVPGIRGCPLAQSP